MIHQNSTTNSFWKLLKVWDDSEHQYFVYNSVVSAAIEISSTSAAIDSNKNGVALGYNDIF